MPSRHPTSPNTRALSVTAAVLGLLGAADAPAALVAGVSFDPANAVTTATVESLGYSTPFGAALPSDTSADWSIGTSLGSRFQRPSFQDGYSDAGPVSGAAGTAVTLGQEPAFPSSGNVREIIRLTWGGTHALADGSGADLAVFEQATSEAFAISVHVTGSGPMTGWSPFFYIPYENAYDPVYDATPTLVDLDTDLGRAGATINALEIASLAPEDTVAEAIAGADPGLGRGQVTFGGALGGLQPARYSSSRDAWVPFEAAKLDPDLQYVVGLHALVPGAFADVSMAASASDGSMPDRAPPTGAPTGVPSIGAAPLLLLGLAGLGALRLGGKVFTKRSATG